MKKWLFPKWKQPLRTVLFTHEIAKAFAENEFEKFRVIRDASYKSDFDKLMEATAEYKA